jgi:hypothetical protein
VALGTAWALAIGAAAALGTGAVSATGTGSGTTGGTGPVTGTGHVTGPGTRTEMHRVLPGTDHISFLHFYLTTSPSQLSLLSAKISPFFDHLCK